MTELLLAVSLINQNPSVTIPVDPAKLEVQVPVDTTFKDSRGVTWELKGTLVARPAPAPAAPPSSTTTPVVNAYRDLEGAWLTAARPGQRFLVVGEGFGEWAGQVFLAWRPVPAAEWGENLIVAEVPAAQPPCPRSVVTVLRPDGAFYSGLAFGVEN